MRRAPPLRMRLGMLGLALLIGASGCVGEIIDVGDEDRQSGPGASGQQKLECEGVAPDTELGLIRMLNRREYANTVRDLLGLEVSTIADFPAEPIVGFDNYADSLVASAALVEKQLEAAESLAAQADLAALAHCPSTSAETTCADQLIQSFGRRAYRRTLDAAEAAILREVFDSAITRGRSYEQAVRLVIETVLQSPQFLYRAERSASDSGGVTLTDGFELASRLSYFLWASMPDDALLDAAENGELAEREKLEAQVRRLLADPKARASTTAFHELWLQLYDLESISKTSQVYPDFSALAPLFKQETERFADWVFWQGGGRADRLLVSDVGFMNDALAAHYGVGAPGTSELTETSLSGTERFGLLTQGAFLARHSNPDRTSPTKRGKFVRQQLLCQPPPPPPGDVPPLPTSGSAGKPIRDMLAAHVQDPACAGCHMLMDPIGFGFERYDTVGRLRAQDNGAPVDDSGELLDVNGGEGSFVGARELSERLTQTEEYYACVATQWFRFAVGRLEGERDGCSLQTIRERFRSAGDSLPELVIAIATSDAMRFKHTVKSP